MRIYGVCKSTTNDSLEPSEPTRQKMGVLFSYVMYIPTQNLVTDYLLMVMIEVYYELSDLNTNNI